MYPSIADFFKFIYTAMVLDKEWKINFFIIIGTRIILYSRNTPLLPLKPKSSFRHLVLVPADKAANNVVVV